MHRLKLLFIFVDQRWTSNVERSFLDVLEKKVELIFQVAHKNNHHVLVLPAFGCGAWKNPPHDVAV